MQHERAVAVERVGADRPHVAAARACDRDQRGVELLEHERPRRAVTAGVFTAGVRAVVVAAARAQRQRRCQRQCSAPMPRRRKAPTLCQ
jgi:hypothetical protein